MTGWVDRKYGSAEYGHFCGGSVLFGCTMHRLLLALAAVLSVVLTRVDGDSLRMKRFKNLQVRVVRMRR